MKKYTHAWLAFKAIERLENTNHSTSNQKYVDSLINWFMNHRDSVIQGAWYPDEVIKDMANSHVLKFTPAQAGSDVFRNLPTNSLLYGYGKSSELYKKPYNIDKEDNLPDRCEAIAHSVIDNLKMQEKEHKGSPISPTDNHVATLLFMLSHYIADAHMPFHCDSRRFSEGDDLHAYIEKQWDDEIQKYYSIDHVNERFFYNPQGYPLIIKDNNYEASFLKKVDDELKGRKFIITWGSGNNNVWDYMSALCQYSYLLSYSFIPPVYDQTNVTINDLHSLNGQKIDSKNLNVAVFSDTIDSIAKIWLRIWRKYMKWL